MTALFQRVFKTKWFSKAAADKQIGDDELCKAAKALMAGQGDDLGGNVWKKRLDRNQKRGIVLNRIGNFWIFVFLFAKKDRENIDDAELKAFRNAGRSLQHHEERGHRAPDQVKRICGDLQWLRHVSTAMPLRQFTARQAVCMTPASSTRKR